MKVRPSPTVTVRTRDELLAPGTAFDVRARVDPAPTSGTVSFHLGGPIEPCQDLPVDPVSGRVSCHVVPDVTGRRYVDAWFSGNDDLSVTGGGVPVVLSTFDLDFVRPRSHAQVRAGDRLDVRLELEENRFPMAEHLAIDVLEGCDLEVRAFGRTWCPDRYERRTFVARIRVPASTETGRALLEAVFRGWGRKLATAARAVEVHAAMNQPTIAP
jgi:hypothetical protein